MRASNHIPVAKICARIENINEVWFYDAAGRQTSVTGGGGTTTYAFNAAGNLTQSTDPLGYVTTNAYDSLPNRP